MKLDFNETNILVQTVNDLVKYKKTVNKRSLIESLCELSQNTDKNYTFIHQSITSLISKVEKVSEKSVDVIHKDVVNDNIIAMACYALPQL